MSLVVGAFVVLADFVTAAVSGVLGMAGGLLLLGALLLVLPVAVAFVVHGLLQLVSNGWRAFLQRAHIAWRTVGWYAAGALVAVVGVSAVAYVPSRALTYLLLGLVPWPWPRARCRTPWCSSPYRCRCSAPPSAGGCWTG